MEVFLYNGDKTYSYDQLMDEIHQQNEYYPCYQSNNLFNFFVNLTKAIIFNRPLVLLDTDLSATEISSLAENKLNEPVALPHIQFNTFDEVIAALQSSTSEITIFTSGTTGQPKKVIHSISTLTRSVRCGEKYREQVWAYAYNPTHMAGLQVFFQAFENKNTLVNVFNNSRKEVYQKITAHNITHISATPTFYRLLLPVEKEYPTIIRATLGGEKSDTHLHEQIQRIFPKAKINNVYASTEAGTLFAAKGEYFEIPTRIKELFQVVDDELLIHKSLLGKSDSFALENDFYHSGDLIEWIDESKGLFKFKSRKNELINVGGYKVNPTEVEDILNSIQGIQQSLVYGKANAILGNVLCAELKLEEGITLTEVDVRQQLKDSLQDFKIPRRIKFVDTFTLTRTGKLKRQ